MVKVIVLGACGQLGNCLKKATAQTQLSGVVFLDRQDLDILDRRALKKVFKEYEPTHVVNCAAYTAVDLAEDEQDLCRQINKKGAQNIAEECAASNIVLVHISTDFVFDGTYPLPLTENNQPKPINHYGLAKLEGEEAIRKILKKYYILRTSWLYSEYGNNFVKTMLKLGKDRDVLNVVSDQVGTPTYAMDLAKTILTIIDAPKHQYGLYHYSNEGVASWYDFAKAIFELANSPIVVHPIPASAYPTKAKRPPYSVLDKSKIKENFDLQIPYWRDSLKECITELKKH